MNALSPQNKVTKGKLGGKSFLYNPEAFSDGHSVNYNEITSAGISYPINVYGGGQQRTITFSLYLSDRVEPGITKKFISHLHNFVPPANKKGYQFVAPKPIQFAFGWMVRDCYLQSMDIDYSEFSPDLQPIEATINLTLRVIR